MLRFTQDLDEVLPPAARKILGPPRTQLPGLTWEVINPTAIRRPPLKWIVLQWFKLLLDGSFFVPILAWLGRRLGLAVAYCTDRGVVIHPDDSITVYGVLSRRVITTAGITYLAADFAGGASDVNLFKFHGYGTGTTAEAIGDTALVTELTTEYSTNSTRPTGSQGSAAGVYTTIGTLTPDSGGTLAITEHGIFSATSSTTLWDRSKFSAVNLDSTAGDSLQTTHATTFPGGS